MLPIEHIEIFVTDLTGRLQRRKSSGTYDTGEGGSWIGKPVLLKLHAGGLAAFCQLEAAAAAHFFASTPEHLIMPAGEFVFGLGVIGPDPPVPEPKFTVRDSCTRVPDAPGLGVEIDEEALKRLTLYRAEVTEKA